MTSLEQVKQLMIERQLPISAALKILKIRPGTFYKEITELDKTELRHIKMSFSSRGNKGNFKKGL
jgi:hypothetical protein